jgi:branched-chain amino acid transport system substrate-binding protein
MPAAIMARRRGGRALAVAVIAALVMASCTEDDDGAETDDEAAADESGQADSGGEGGGDADVVTDYVEFTGATEGAADTSEPPIAIGFVNAQGGANELPEATAGAEAAVEYINDELGGIGGRPVELRTCFIVEAEEEGQACAQQLANDDEVSVIVFGAVVTGNESFHATIAGSKPVIIGVSANPADDVAENTYALYGTQTSVLGPWGTFASEELGAETAAVVFPSQAGANTAADASTAGLEAAGIEVTSVGYDAEATDLLGPLTAAGGQDADVVVPMTDAAGCSNLANALAQVAPDTPVVSNPLCLSPLVAEALGGDLPQWTYGIAQSLPGDPTAEDSAVYLETSAQYGLAPEDAGTPFAALSWGMILTVARFMNEVGPDGITPESMTEQAEAFEGPLIMGAPSVDCGYDPDAPAACNNQTKFYAYNGGGAFEAVSDWLRPPE